MRIGENGYLYKELNSLYQACIVLDQIAAKHAVAALKEKDWTPAVEKKIDEMACHLLSGDFDMAARHADEMIDLVVDSGGIEYALDLGCKYAAKAKRQLEYLPAGPARQSLAAIADFIVQRSF